ncbi:hypothetical protein ABT364_04735 [Massilia sp. SR12]
MEQDDQQQRILGHTVGREITLEEMNEIAGAQGGAVGTGPFYVGRQLLYRDLGPDPTQ